MLKTAHTTPTEITLLATINHKPVTVKPLERSRNHIGGINHVVDNEWKEIVLSAFDLSMRRISFGNGGKLVSAIAFEVHLLRQLRHPQNRNLLLSGIFMGEVLFYLCLYSGEGNLGLYW